MLQMLFEKHGCSGFQRIRHFNEMNLNARVNIKSISSHCNLIQLQNVFILLYLFSKIPHVHHTKLSKNIPNGYREKVILLSLLV